MSEVTVERSGHVMVVTLNRPEVRNALNDDMFAAISAALGEASRDVGVRAVVLTGAGDAFCSGIDTRRIKNRGGVFEGTSAPRTRHGYTHGVQLMTAAFHACEVPIIAAVNGPALGLGFDLTIQSDIRIAARNAVFSEAFVTMGLVPGDGGFWFLPRIVGYARALELTVTGRRIDAATAELWGLVSQVVEPGEALDVALNLANDIASRSPHAVRISKRLLRNAGETSLHTALDMGALAQAVLTGSHDQLEAAAATINRRDAAFEDR